MEETELEKIIQPIFAEVGDDCGARRFHSASLLRGTSHDAIALPRPWFCAGDEEFKEFMRNGQIFYKCATSVVMREYVITPLFYVRTGHDASCYDPSICKHTTDYIVNFLMKPLNEQEKEIDKLIVEGLFNDRLQLLWQMGNVPHIFQLGSEAAVKHNDAGYFVSTGNSAHYYAQFFEGVAKVPEHAQVVLRKMWQLFDKKEIVRGELHKYPGLPALIKKAVRQPYTTIDTSKEL
ncbi:hypothetical protein HY485_00240 [Candidatus Woesearchaeota archaeon]|nr:hypothetical protein [Candidatus Woesearchaeota archaeon]